MYFSRVKLDSDRADAARLSRLAGGGLYSAHQFLWRLFSSGEGSDRELERPFIYRAMGHEVWPVFYLLSARQPQDRDGYCQVACKPFEPLLHKGLRLWFDLRVNPVRRCKTDDGRQKRHDVVMDMKQQRKAANEAIDPHVLEHNAALTWLSDRASKLGFRLIEDTFAADGYQQHVISRGGKSSPIRFSSLDMRGCLEVLEPEVFRDALYEGIGPAKGFGCGLLLVRPA